MKKLLRQLFKKAVDVKPNELRALGFVFNFLVLASYYGVRRIRDDIGAAGGLDNLSWMYSGTMVVMLPAREVLFTVLHREDKYKAKSFTDTFVYRAGDQIGAWSYPLLTSLGFGLTGISFVAAPVAALWYGLSLWLGRKQGALTREREGQVVQT